MNCKCGRKAIWRITVDHVTKWSARQVVWACGECHQCIRPATLTKEAELQVEEICAMLKEEGSGLSLTAVRVLENLAELARENDSLVRMTQVPQ